MTSVAPAQARITQRICEAIKGQIASGLLAPGARLPSTRSLAAEWGVSRTTVTAAYEQLIAEGYLETRQGAAGAGRAGACASAGATRSSPLLRTVPDRLSAYGQRLADFTPPPERDRERFATDFRYGDLAGADFPRLAWRKAVTAALLRGGRASGMATRCGSPDLRTALQGYLWRARGLRCEPDQIVVVNGSQQGIDLCARLLLDPGDRVVMENPGYNLARQAFLAAGAEVIPVAVDQEGMRTEELPAARLAYTTPSHQFPLGSVMSAARRRDLLAWAQRSGAYVIEDDYDSEYRFDIAPIPPLQALDGAGTGHLSRHGLQDALADPAPRLSRRPDGAGGDLRQGQEAGGPAYAGPGAGGPGRPDRERRLRAARAARPSQERPATCCPPAALSATLGDEATVVGAEPGFMSSSG